MKKIEHILFVNESEKLDQTALQDAIKVAKTNFAKLTVAGCLGHIKKSMKGRSEAHHQAVLEVKTNDIKNQLTELTDDDVTVKVFVGKPFIDIIREVIEFDVDLVIKPIETESLSSVLFGSQDLKLLRMCPCPLWLVKPPVPADEKHIIVAIDHEPDNPENEQLNKDLLAMGISLSLAQFAEMHVVHAWRLENESFMRGPRMDYTDAEVDAMAEEEKTKRHEWLTNTVNESLKDYGEEASEYIGSVLHLSKGNPAKCIPDLVEKLKPELLIMGTVGRTGIPGFFIGNTAESILFDVECSVMALKPEAFESPVKLEK